jgi:hypothetical protein
MVTGRRSPRVPPRHPGDSGPGPDDLGGGGRRTHRPPQPTGHSVDGRPRHLDRPTITAQNGCRMSSIEFNVTGWPPIQNEAKSLFAAGHAHRDRVERLLRAAAAAAEETSWVRVGADTNISLDVVVRSPTPRPPADAINFLGGIGDVLQGRSSRPTSTCPTSVPSPRSPCSTTTGRSSASPTECRGRQRPFIHRPTDGPTTLALVPTASPNRLHRCRPARQPS